MTRRKFFKITALGTVGAMAFAMDSPSMSAASPAGENKTAYLKQFVKVPVINSHVHILPRLRYDTAGLIAEMDRTGQDVAVFQLMDKVPRANRTVLEYLKDGKSYCAEAPGRLIPFMGIHPGNPEALQLAEAAVQDYGIVGFGEMIFSLWARNRIGKAYGLDREILPSDKKYCWPFFKKLQDLGAVAVIDATQLDGGDGVCYSSADHFEEIAKAFPGLNFVIAAACITSDLTGENTEKCIQLCQSYDNVYLDVHDWQVVEDPTGRFAVHGFQKRGGIKYFYSFLRRLFDHEKSRSKILFGSDWPLANLTIGMNELEWLQIIMENAKKSGYPFSTEEWEMFFGLNALGFLRKSKYFDETKFALAKS